MRLSGLVLLCSAIAACSGGTGGTGITGNATSNAVSIGVMTKGSVIVNGVSFDATKAAVTVDGTPKTPDALQSGMVVWVRGEINDDGVTGSAQLVNAQGEVKGTVQTHSSAALPPVFTVVGQTVYVDDQTVFANFAGSPTPAAAVSQLSDAVSVVEVHGLRNIAGSILATRVELISAPVPGNDELRGVVEKGSLDISSQTFMLQNGAADLAVSYTGAVVSPAPAALVEGAVAEVLGAFNSVSGTFGATHVSVEDDTPFQHKDGDEFDIQGQVNGCSVAGACVSPFTAPFFVGSRSVQATPSTRFENGSAADLADGVIVEAEGHTFLGTTVLVAEKVTFTRSRVVLNGQVTSASPGGSVINGNPAATGITVLNRTIQLNDLTRFVVNNNGTIPLNDRVEVLAHLDASGNIVAEQVTDNPSGGNKDAIQDRVTAVNGTVLTLSTGIKADLATATEFKDGNGQQIANVTAFVAAITPASGTAPGTLVKVKGAFNAGTNTIAAEEAELED